MKKYFLIFLVLVTSTVNAQQTKKTTNKLGERKETFYVLKSNDSIKHGKYSINWNWKFYHSIIKEGQYSKGKKKGVWLEYYRFRGKYDENDMRVKYLTTYLNDKKEGTFIQYDYNRDTIQIGLYKNNIKTGVWKRFKNGNLIEHYDYSTNENLITKKDFEKGNEKVDVLPRIIEGDLNKALIENFHPVNSKNKKSLLSKVDVEMIITKNGIVNGIEIVGADYPELKNELEQALRETKGKWESALKNGTKVDVKVKFQIQFLIEWKRKKHRVGMKCSDLIQL